MRLRLGFVVAAAVWVAASPAWAQVNPSMGRGIDVDKLYQYGEIDTVDLQSGTLSLSIPIGPRYPVSERLSYGLTLSHTSRVWEYGSRTAYNQYVGVTPHRRSNAGIGWFLHLGLLIAPTDPYPETYGSWTYISPDGGTHDFFDTLHGEETNADEGDFGDVWDATRDSTYLRLHHVSANVKELEFGDGTIKKFEHLAGRPSHEYRLSEIRDRFASGGQPQNWVRIAYNDSALTWTITDARGRSHTVQFASRSYDGTFRPTVSSVSLAAFDGSPGGWTFSYVGGGATSIYRDCQAANGTAELTAPVLLAVTQPGGSAWSFVHYDDPPGPPTYSCKQSELQQVTFPTGGRIQYNYSLQGLPANDPCPDDFGGEIYMVVVTSRTFVDPIVVHPAPADATWTYSYTISNPPPATDLCEPGQIMALPPEELKVTVQTPRLDKTEYFFSVWPAWPVSPNGFRHGEYGLPFTRFDSSGGRFLTSKTYDCDTGGGNCQVVRKEYLNYEQDASGLRANRRVSGQRTVYVDDSNTFADTAFSSFDGVGHYRTATTDGSFAGSVAHRNDRVTTTNYNPGRGTYPPPGYNVLLVSEPWVLETFDYTDQIGGYDADLNGRQSRKLFDFDGATGFLKSIRTLKLGATASVNDLFTLYCADISGNVANELSYGGDGSRFQLPGTLPTCSSGPPTSGWQYRVDHTHASGVRATSKYNGTTFFTLDLDINANTGLPSFSRDSAGVATEFKYDDLGRLTRAIPQAFGSLGRDAQTEYTYWNSNGSAPASVEIERCGAGQASCNSSNRLTYEYVEVTGFGQPWHEVRDMPDTGDWAVRASRYDGMGSKTRVSSWLYTPSVSFADETALAGTSWTGYDPFWRPASMTLADGEETTYEYLGAQWVKTTQSVAQDINGTESAAYRWEGFDRFGQLFRVEEFARAEDQTDDVPTEYSYDESGRLSIVCEYLEASACKQARFFAYDNRGFLSSETHPEKGDVDGNDNVTYYCFDAGGHARYRRDGTSDNTRRLGFTYDAAERLIKVRLPDATESCAQATETGTTWKQFTYATANSSGQADKGKLKTAFRHNIVSAPYPSNTSLDVTETYTYAGQWGRVSRRATQLAANGANQELWSYSQNFDSLGNLTTVNYPTCTGGYCGNGSLIPGRTITMTYEQGLLETVTDSSLASWIDDMAYHPSAMVKEVDHGNGTREIVSIAANGISRPSAIEVKYANNPALWQTGTYSYDGAGNVKAMGAGKFRYDKVSRLVEARLNLFGAANQTFGFDPFANLTSITTGGTTENFPVYDTDPGPNYKPINRLALPATYDPGGNLTAWNGNTYGYDLFNMMTDLCTNGALASCAGERWTYAYTADDERILSVNPHYTPNGAWLSWSIRDLANRTLRRFVYDASGLLITQTSNDSIYRGDKLVGTEAIISAGFQPPYAEGFRHFGLDHLGTVRVITKSATPPALLAQHSYYPFGREFTSPSQDAEPWKFTGHERDLHASWNTTADDLDYLHARFRSPLTGRFLSIDPAGGDPTQPQSWNRYTYVMGNPLKYTDPDGKLFKELFDSLKTWISEKWNAAFPQLQTQRMQNVEELEAEIGPTGDQFNQGGAASKALGALNDTTTTGLAAVATGAVVVATGAEIKGGLQALSAAGDLVVGRGGLTAAGRALQKHSARSGSAFPAARGSASEISGAAQGIVDDILTSPGSTTTIRNTGRFGRVIEVHAPDGRGLRYSSSGQFIGFLEP